MRCAALVVPLTLLIAIGTTAQAIEKVRVSADEAVLHLLPDGSSPVVITVYRGTILEVELRGPDWLRVHVPTQGNLPKSAFVSAYAVAPYNEAHPLASPGAAPQENGTGGSHPTAGPPLVAPGPAQAQPPASATKDTLGVGVCLGGYSFGVGGGLRAWSKQRLGFSGCVSHYGVSSAGTSAGVSSSFSYSILQISPGVLFKLKDAKPEGSTRICPYVGGGLSLARSSASASASALGVSVTEGDSATKIGAFGLIGVEFRFKNPDWLGLSAEFGYFTTAEPLVGLSLGGTALVALGHWYIK